MFVKTINQTNFASEVADRLFSNITETGSPDKSFISTLRALLHNRVPKDETVNLTCKAIQLSDSEAPAVNVIESLKRLQIPDMLQKSDEKKHTIFIIHSDIGDKLLDLVESTIGAGTSYFSNYTRKDDLRVFYVRKAKSLIYTDDTGRNAIIFASALELKHFHALQMTIALYLPQLFANTPVSEKEMSLLRSTGNKSAAEYEALLEDFAQGIDMRSENIRGKLAGFETSAESTKRAEVQARLEALDIKYKSKQDELREISNEIQDAKILLAGLDSHLEQHPEDSDLINYFICNKNLTVIKTIGTALEFVVHGHVSFFDEAAFEKYGANHTGYMYKGLRNGITPTQMEMLYRSIFSDNRYKLRICAAYTVDVRVGITAMTGYSFPTECSTHLPNPHIQNQGCIGGFAERFQEYILRQDYVGAIEQASVSARNLNLFDSTVMTTFAKQLSGTSKKCIETSSGELLTPLEAIKELEGGAA